LTVTRDHRIAVVGEATRKVMPDRVRWSATVQAVGITEAAAFDPCSLHADEVIRALRAVATADGDVSTSHMRVQPRWDSERSRYSGFEASSTISVESTSDLAGRLAQAILTAGASRLVGPSFLVSNPEAVERELLPEALAAAQAKASILSVAAARQLGRVVSVAEPSASAGEIYGVRQLAADYSAGPDVVAEALPISVALAVVFELSD